MPCATSWVLDAVGMPVPMSRNCLMPRSSARKRTVRPRNARVLRTEATMSGSWLTASSPASRSASKWSLPPSQ